MSDPLANALVRESLISAAILVGSYLAARLLSFLLGAALDHSVRTPTAHALIQSLKKPLTYALFLVGAYVAVHRLPVQDRWTDRLDDLLFTLSVLVVALAALRAYRSLLGWYATESRLGAENVLTREFSPLLRKLGTLVIALVALITVLQHLRVDVNSLVVSLGVGSLAVGLAAQDTLANMLAGFTLMLDRPFKMGERIQLATGEVGDVMAIGIRATRIKTTDETTLVIPNSLLVKERLLNQSQPRPLLTSRVDVGVAYGSDLARVKRILAEAALASPRVDDARAPVVLLTRFGEYAVQLRLVFWARDFAGQGLAVSDVHEEVYRRLREAGIDMPFPTRRLIQEKAGSA